MSARYECSERIARRISSYRADSDAQKRAQFSYDQQTTHEQTSRTTACFLDLNQVGMRGNGNCLSHIVISQYALSEEDQLPGNDQRHSDTQTENTPAPWTILPFCPPSGTSSRVAPHPFPPPPRHNRTSGNPLTAWPRTRLKITRQPNRRARPCRDNR